jgi:hypothetical protein
MEVGEIPDAARNQESRTCDLGGVLRHALAGVASLTRNGSAPGLAIARMFVFGQLKGCVTGWSREPCGRSEDGGRLSKDWRWYRVTTR